MAEQDWRVALPFVEEALAIDPGDPGAANVRRMLDDLRQREQIDRYLLKARDLQTDRKLAEALAEVEEGLREFPNEIRLSQLRNTLQAATAETSLAAGKHLAAAAGAAPAGWDATRIFSTEAEREDPIGFQPAPGIAADPIVVAPPQRPSRSLSAEPPGMGLKTKLFLAAVALVLMGALFLFRLNSVHSAPAIVTQDLPSSPNAQQPNAKPVAAVSAPDAAQRSLSPSATLPVKDPSKNLPASQTAVGPDFSNFSLNSDPSGASVIVDGDAGLSCTTPCAFPLLKGIHKLTFSKAGYEPAQRSVHVPEDISATELLNAVAQKVRILSDPPGATLTVDGEPRGVTPKTVPLMAGAHKVILSSVDRTVEEEIKVTPESLVFTINLTGEVPDSAPPAAPSPPAH